MGKKAKKKGQGIEKTALKTEKNAQKREKKALIASGEKFIDELLKEITIKNSHKKPTVHDPAPPPTARSCCPFLAHPSQDLLFLHGGEKYSKDSVDFFDDLYIFDIRKKSWTQIISPDGPLPRSSHQMVYSELNGGSLWLFGGEFISPSESQFHHFSDLWEFSLQHKIWRQIQTRAPMAARSGHRMVLWQRKNTLLVFGGFQMTNSVSRWFNDLLAFDLVSRTWIPVEYSGEIPSPRSGVAFFSDGGDRFFIYGGYSSGKVLGDLFTLTLQKGDKLSVHFARADVGGATKPVLRSGFGYCSIGPGRIALFGGSNESSEGDSAVFVDLAVLDVGRRRWFVPTIKGAEPHVRTNCSLCSKNGMIYLFGGSFESDDYSEMFCDFYSIDLFKLDEWNVIVGQAEGERMVESEEDEDREGDDDEEEESMDLSD